MSAVFTPVEIKDRGDDICQVSLGIDDVWVKHFAQGVMTAMLYTAEQAQALAAAIDRAANLLPSGEAALPAVGDRVTAALGESASVTGMVVQVGFYDDWFIVQPDLGKPDREIHCYIDEWTFEILPPVAAIPDVENAVCMDSRNKAWQFSTISYRSAWRNANIIHGYDDSKALAADRGPLVEMVTKR